MTVEILEKQIEIAYTLEAQEEITKKFGGVGKEQMERIFDTTDREAFVSRIAFLISTFSTAAKHRTAVRAKMLGETVEKTETPSTYEISATLKVLTPAELAEVTGGILLAITVGNRGEVETKERGGKKKDEKE